MFSERQVEFIFTMADPSERDKGGGGVRVLGVRMMDGCFQVIMTGLVAKSLVRKCSEKEEKM